jgi:membrane-associated protein
VTTTLALGPEWLQPDTIITWLGPWALIGLAVIVFVECGLWLFFLPGDSLLFTAGLFVASGAIGTPLWLVCVILTAAAFLGNVCGYYIGRAAGPAIFDRPKSRLLKPEHVAKTQAFFDKYGNRAIVMARFVPVVRTFITVMAGVGKMDPKRFFVYSAIGGVLWAAGITVLGFFLGQIEFVRENIELMLILIVLLSVLPIIFELVKARREAKHAGPPAPPDGVGEAAADLVADIASDVTTKLPPVTRGHHGQVGGPENYTDATQPIPRHQPGGPRPYGR